MKKFLFIIIINILCFSQNSETEKYRKQFVSILENDKLEFLVKLVDLGTLSEKLLKKNEIQKDPLLYYTAKFYIEFKRVKLEDEYEGIHNNEKIINILDEIQNLVKVDNYKEFVSQIYSFNDKIDEKTFTLFLKGTTIYSSIIRARYYAQESEYYRSINIDYDKCGDYLNKWEKENKIIENEGRINNTFDHFIINLLYDYVVGWLKFNQYYRKSLLLSQKGLQKESIDLLEFACSQIDKNDIYYDYYTSKYNLLYFNYFLNAGDYENAIFYMNKFMRYKEKGLALNKKINVSEKKINYIKKLYNYSRHNPLFNLGYLYVKKGDYSKANENFLISYQIRLKHYPITHNKIIASENWIAYAYLLSGNLLSAKHYLDLAEVHLGNVDNQYADDYAEFLMFKGIYYTRKNEYKKALSTLNLAMKATVDIVSKEHEYVADIYKYLGDLYLKQGQYDMADRQYYLSTLSLTLDTENFDLSENKKSIPVYEKTRKPIQFLRLLVKRAQLNQMRNNISEIERISKAGLDYIKRVDHNYYNSSSKFIMNTIISELYEFKIKILHDNYVKTNSKSYLNDLVKLIDEAKSGNLYREVALKNAVINSSSISKEWLELRNMKLDILNKENNNINVDDIKSEHIKEYKKITSKLPNIDDQLNLEELNIELSEGKLLINYFITSNKLYLYTISKNTNSRFPNIEMMISKVDDRLRTNVSMLLRKIKKMDGDLTEQNNALTDILIKPIKETLKKFNDLTIIPHHYLSNVPFSALKLNNKYMIEENSISYHYSLNLYLINQKQKKDATKFTYDLAAFAPVFEQAKNSEKDQSRTLNLNEDVLRSSNFRSSLTRHGDFATLKESFSEIKQISEIFENEHLSSKIFTYQNASEKNFKEYVNQSRITHVSTHSFYNEIDYNKSAIIFAKPLNDSQDGILYSNESYYTNFNTDLLVLSSCESGKGKLIANEGMLSLTRGFYYSGAKNILSSLWKVSDQKTKLLMVEFYKSLIENNTSYKESLRQAQLYMIKNTKTNHPNYWSAFNLIGQ